MERGWYSGSGVGLRPGRSMFKSLVCHETSLVTLSTLSLSLNLCYFTEWLWGQKEERNHIPSWAPWRKGNIKMWNKSINFQSRQKAFYLGNVLAAQIAINKGCHAGSWRMVVPQFGAVALSRVSLKWVSSGTRKSARFCLHSEMLHRTDFFFSFCFGMVNFVTQLCHTTKYRWS